MNTTETDRLVDDYLRRLDAAASHLQRTRRAELLAEIREHIETALGEEDAAGEAAVRNVLERLGSPEEIVEAAEPPTEPRRRTGALEITAVIALLVPVLGWLVGIVLVVISEAWSRREKALGVALALVPVLVPALGLVISSSGTSEPVPPAGPSVEAVTDDGSNTGELVVWVVLLLAGVPSAVYLGWRLRRRPDVA
jgi:hypothetical protein